MGCFSHPSSLFADFCICFPNCNIMTAFVHALLKLGYNRQSLQICGSRVCFSYGTAATFTPCGFFAKLARCLAQWKNRIFCKLYLYMTRPFSCTVDRLLYLYFYLPFLFRRCLRLRRCRCKKYKKICKAHRKKCFRCKKKGTNL